MSDQTFWAADRAELLRLAVERYAERDQHDRAEECRTELAELDGVQ